MIVTKNKNTKTIITDDGRLDARKLFNVPLTKEVLEEAIPAFERLNERCSEDGGNILAARCRQALQLVQAGASNVMLMYPSFEVQADFSFRVNGDE